MHLIDRRDYILAHKPYDRDRMRRQNTELDPLAFACDNALITQPCRDDRNRAAAICYGAWQTVVEKRPKIILLRGGMCSVGTREECFKRIVRVGYVGVKMVGVTVLHLFAVVQHDLLYYQPDDNHRNPYPKSSA